MHQGTTRALRPCLAGALLAVAGSGCGGSGPVAPVPRPVAAAECVVRGGDSARAGELLVALAEPRDSVLLGHREVDTPIRLDCLGRPRPGLASAWSRDSTGRAWTLTLAEAGAVAGAWRRSPEASATLRFAAVESVVPLDDRRLVVTFRQPHDSLPGLFADPALGVARDSLAPLGLARDSVARLPLRAIPARDPRDAIDQGADIVRTADPGVLDYAASRSGSSVIPLPWDRTYALVVPPGSSGLGGIEGADTAAFRAALAGDAVRTEARGAIGPFWWTTVDCAPHLSGHSPPSPSVPSQSSPSRTPAVLYYRDDETARGLAARLVAMSEVSDAVARGVGPAELAAALRAGTARGYVVALPRRALVPCREIAGWPPGARAFALIDTRARLVLRDGVPPLEVEYDGALRPAVVP